MKQTTFATLAALAVLAWTGPVLAGPMGAGMPMQAHSLSAQDASFMQAAAQGGEAEVAAASLALRQASAPTVKTFAQMMLHDHGMANVKLASLAKAKGFMLPSDIGIKNKKMKGTLQSLHGSAFDATYVAGQKTAHAETAVVFEKEIANGKDADVVAFAKMVLPKVRQHQRTLLGFKM